MAVVCHFDEAGAVVAVKEGMSGSAILPQFIHRFSLMARKLYGHAIQTLSDFGHSGTSAG